MHKKFNIDKVKVFDLIRPETRVWTRLEKALKDEGVDTDSGLIELLIEFAKTLIEFQNWKKIGSKRDWENNLDFRILTIRRIAKQLKMDEPIVDDFLGSDFLKRQIIFALFDKATLIYERSQSRDVRETTSMDMQLLKLVKTLKKQNTSKPIETLASALQRSGVLKDISKTGWSVRTLQNRISLISKKSRVLKNANGNKSPMQLATIYLQKQLPQHASLIVDLSRTLPKMTDKELYVLLPVTSKFIFSYLFNDVVSV